MSPTCSIGLRSRDTIFTAVKYLFQRQGDVCVCVTIQRDACKDHWNIVVLMVDFLDNGKQVVAPQLYPYGIRLGSLVRLNQT
ncbi:hypothetical protein TNCV_1480871 [Trichonephila clavipes]|nr:hypothetical protein TNCV_1480871 [Trichonephila clavipes]